MADLLEALGQVALISAITACFGAALCAFFNDK